MRVLVACECSGLVREAFTARGHKATSCDLIPTEIEGNHYLGNVLDIIDDGWDMMVAFPPCTYLCSSSLHWNARRPGRARKTAAALRFVSRLLDCSIPRIALENPIGCIGTRIRPSDQIIQPFHFGENASKRTCLWLKNLPPLTMTRFISPRWFYGKPRWGNQDDRGQNILSSTQSKDRARTYAGIANAMAEQWGRLSPLPRK